MYRNRAEATIACFNLLEQVLDTGKDCRLVYDMSVSITDEGYSTADDSGLFFKTNSYFKISFIQYNDEYDDTIGFDMKHLETDHIKVSDLRDILSERDEWKILRVGVHYYENDSFNMSLSIDFQDLFKLKILQHKPDVVTENEIVPLNIDL